MNRIVRPLFNYYTAGENINSLVLKINQLSKKNIYPIADYIKENINNQNELTSITDEYNKLGKLSELEFIAIKLSSFNFNEKVVNRLVSDLITNNKKVMIDAEQNIYQDKVEKITDNLIRDYNKFEPLVFKTYQMYRKDSLEKLHSDFRFHDNLGVKLVRGAYLNEDKSSGKLFTYKQETDKSYNDALDFIIKTQHHMKAFVCTHNVNNINTLLNTKINNNNIYHASLYGFVNNETEKLIEKKIKTYKYLPYGKFEDSIPYLTRRLYENPKIFFHLFN